MRLPSGDIRANIPVAFAQVWLQEYPGIASITNANGDYVLHNVPFGEGYRVVAKFVATDPAGVSRVYKIRSQDVSVTTAEPVRGDANLDLQLADRTVSGILRDPRGNPVPFATLTLWGETFQTDADGRFEAPPLPPPASSEAEITPITVSVPGYTTSVILALFTPGNLAFVEGTLPSGGETGRSPQITVVRESGGESVRAGGNTTVWAI